MISVLYFMIMLTQMILAGVMICKSNNDCLEGSSCVNNICKKCFKCNLLRREGSDCVADFNDCGQCLIGYEEELIRDSSKAIKPCKPVRLKRKFNQQKCINDDNCPPNSYCSEYFCVKCFNCGLVNRLLQVGKCAKGLSDCGSCVNGFREVAVTADTNLKSCESPNITVPSSLYMATFLHLAYSSLLILFLLALSVLMNTKRDKGPKNYSVLKKSICPQLPSAPPLYVMEAPPLITNLEEQQSRRAFTVEQKQQAKVFKQPTALYYNQDDIRESVPGLEERQMPYLGRIFVHNYNEQISSSASATDSPQQPHEMSTSAIANDEVDNQQQEDSSVADNTNALPDTNSVEE